MHKVDIRATPGQNNRILLIEDDNSIRTIISKSLSFMGYHVVTAGSGEEGLDLFLNGAFDLVVTDFNMSGMDGFALSYHIKEKSPDTPIILITGSEKDTIRGRLKKGRFFDLILFKPFRFLVCNFYAKSEYVFSGSSYLSHWKK